VSTEGSPLDAWLQEQYRRSVQYMLRSISATGIVKSRPGFGTTVCAAPGSVVASPVLGAYDPEPDYFFHWFRDSAVVIDALRLPYLRGLLGGQAPRLFWEYVAFSRSLQQLDGGALVAEPAWRARVQPDFAKFLRTDADLARAHGEAIAGETRVNPDATLDISGWPRPQHDGPATRALALQRWLALPQLPAQTRAGAEELLAADLAYARAHWREDCYDIWEEELGLHYYTLCVSAAALAGQFPADAADIRRRLDDYWLPDAGHYRSRVLPDGTRSRKELDIAPILAAIHAGASLGGDPGASGTSRTGGSPGSTPTHADSAPRHGVADPRLHATLARLTRLFERTYAINRDRPPGRGVAMGRYEGDVYYSGGAYYFSTLGAAEFCYRAARSCGDGRWVTQGDAYLEAVRAHTPAGGELSEQFDRESGAQTSARHLAWSYAALITCAEARWAAAGP